MSWTRCEDSLATNFAFFATVVAADIFATAALPASRFGSHVAYQHDYQHDYHHYSHRHDRRTCRGACCSCSTHAVYGH